MPSRHRAAYRKPMALAPGLTASVTLVVEEGDTALAMRQRRRTRARHAAGHRARRAGKRRRPSSGRLARRQDHRRLRGPARAPLAHAGRRGGDRRGHARGDRGPAAHVPGLGQRRPRARRRRPDHAGRRRCATASSSARRSRAGDWRSVLVVERARRARDAHARTGPRSATRSRSRCATRSATRSTSSRDDEAMKCVVITGSGPGVLRGLRPVGVHTRRRATTRSDASCGRRATATTTPFCASRCRRSPRSTAPRSRAASTSRSCATCASRRRPPASRIPSARSATSSTDRCTTSSAARSRAS